MAADAGAPRDVGVFTTDAELVVQSWDAWLARHSGIAAAAALGQPLTTLLPDLEERRLLPRFEQALVEGTPSVLAPAFHHYLLRCPPDPPSAYFDAMQQRVTIAPLRDGERIAGVIVTIENVTARLERERAAGAADPPEPLRPAAASAAPVGGLRASDWQARRVAVSGLLQQPAPAVVADVLRAMRDEHHDLGLLNSALQVLAVADVDVVGPLSEFVRHPDADLRIYAAQALGEHSDARSSAALTAALEDPDPNVRFHAVEALGKLRATDAVPALAAMAASGDFFLAFAAIDALRLIGDARAAAEMVPLLADPLLRAPASEALGVLGDAAIVAPLTALLATDTAPTTAIAAAIATLYERYEARFGEGAAIMDRFRAALTPPGADQILAALHTAAPDELRSLVLLLSALDDAATSRALVALLGQAQVRPAVIEALVRFGSGVTAALLEQLDGDDPDTRMAALVALGRVGDPAAVPAILMVLEREPELQIAAADALAKIGDHRAFDTLLARIGHPEVGVRQAAIAALNSLGHPDLETRVVPLLDAADPLVREGALRVAGYFGFADAVDAILRRCVDADEQVRQAALDALPYLDDPRALPVLRAALCDDTPKARAAAARALGQSDFPDAAALLAAALADPDGWVRYFAVRALGQLARPTSAPALIARLASDSAGQVRIAAMEALGRIGGAEAVAALLPHATAPDPDERRAAVRALGKTGASAALPALREALREPDPLLRITAVEALSDYGAAAVALLQWVAASDTERSVQEAAITMLGQLDAADAVGALIELLVDAQLRDPAAAALAQKGAAAAPEIMRGLRHLHPVVRETVVEVLARVSGPLARDQLLPALDDTAPAVRLAALAALSELAHPRVAARIAALANGDPDPAVRRAARALLAG